ncbi:restriction endonuclease subunit S [Lactococcus lactis]|uniref:restriction endonuclease subunit S n=1 Tax=Lactococcus lactis TaxID=1358 RepID=UPI00223B6772|nr:restriction endonuclease subunit S [Lactococcus lactis]
MELKVKEPKVRFGEFTGDWEECKLEDILDEFSSKSRIENEHVVLSSTNSGMEIRGGRVSGNSNLGYKIIEDGDLVLSPQNLWLGNININNIGVGLVSPSYKTFKIKNINSGFLGSQLRMPRMLEAYKNSSTQGASVVRRNLELDSFYQITINTPSKNEQDRINTLFKNINKTIEFKENQLEQLKESKKTLLSKMFPKEGVDRPEIRFAGFTDPWEQRKLKDIAQFNPKTVLPDEFEYVDLESVVGTEMISHRTESKDQAPSRAQRLAQKGDVFYQTVRPYQMNNYLYDLPHDNYVFSTGYAQMRPNIDSYFLLNSVQNKQFVQHVLDRSTGTSYPAINSSDLSNIEIHVPSKLSEQQKIGEFFKKLDDTITLHQQELENLKALKKTLLNLMFV